MKSIDRWLVAQQMALALGLGSLGWLQGRGMGPGWAQSSPEPPPLEHPLPLTQGLPPLQPGDTGDTVKRLQWALVQGGWYQGPIDGQYRDSTVAAVQAFQQTQGLPVDGVMGATTWLHLALAVSPQSLWAEIPSPTTLTFSPLVVVQPEPPPSALWLVMMVMIPLAGGGLTYLQHRWQDGRQS